uniref:RING-type domain-containing protein n=1 Tax=Catharus ustulatus TaxID=91951 RepID=A0A8C3ULR2_CATUS
MKFLGWNRRFRGGRGEPRKPRLHHASRPRPSTLQEEAICAICLDYFADPVSIGCGHNFCRGCISRLWARGGAEPPHGRPRCRKTFLQRSFRPNLQLANMVQIIRQLHPRPRPRGPPELCEKHQEPLKLFCEVDEAHHSVVPLDEVVQDCKFEGDLGGLGYWGGFAGVRSVTGEEIWGDFWGDFGFL